MFGSYGELIKRELTTERLCIAEMLNMLVDPIVAIILDYATIDPLIVDALSIKANTITVHEMTSDSKIYYEYSHARRIGPCLGIVIFSHNNRLREWIDYKRADALREVIRLFTDNECTQLYSALINGYRSILQSPHAIDYDSEAD